MCLSIYESHEHWHREGHDEHELNYMYVCTMMKPYDVLNVKNGFVKSVYYGIESTIHNPVVFIGVY
jgi:hypothetical protein